MQSGFLTKRFSPLSIPVANLQAHYDADFGVFSDAGLTLATDGQTIATWADQSGNGNDLDGTSHGPTFRTNKLNGLPGIEFPVGAYYLDGSPLATDYTYSIYVVFEVPDMTTSGYLISQLDQSENDYYWLLAAHGPDEAIQFIARNPSLYTASSTISHSANTPHIAAAFSNAINDRDVTLDGGNEGSNTTSVTLTEGPLDKFVVGGLGRASPIYTDQTIYEILVYDVAHDADTRAKIHENLKSKWNV